MERIKEAVERARTQRGAAGGAGTPEAGGTAEKLERNIEYSETQILEADVRMMRRNKLLNAIEDERVRGAFKMLRTKVEQQMAENAWNACAVTSPTIEDSKSMVAVNLSISLAWSMHRTVLLVDLDLKSPGIHKRFGVKEAPGVIDYLVDDIPIKDLLFNPQIERLTVLPGGHASEKSSELLSSPKMKHLAQELKSRYPERFIIFDLPPLLKSDDAIAFLPNVDCAVLVVEDGETTKREMTEAVSLLKKTNLLGVCLNSTFEGLAEAS